MQSADFFMPFELHPLMALGRTTLGGLFSGYTPSNNAKKEPAFMVLVMWLLRMLEISRRRFRLVMNGKLARASDALTCI